MRMLSTARAILQLRHAGWCVHAHAEHSARYCSYLAVDTSQTRWRSGCACVRLTECMYQACVYWLFIASPSQNARPTLCARQHIHIVHRRERHDTTEHDSSTRYHEQEALQLSLLLCALCALPLACPRQQHEAPVPDLVLEYRTPTCALPLSCPARMLPLAYAGPPTQLCTVTCFLVT